MQEKDFLNIIEKICQNTETFINGNKDIPFFQKGLLHIKLYFLKRRIRRYRG